MDGTLINTAKAVAVGTLYTLWVNYQKQLMQQLSGNKKKVDEISKNLKDLDTLQENIYNVYIHSDADKIDTLKNDVTIQNKVKEAYRIYFNGMGVLDEHIDDINKLQDNRIGYWLAELATERDPTYTFEDVSDEELKEKLDNMGVEKEDVYSGDLYPAHAAALPMDDAFRPRKTKRGEYDTERMIQYHVPKKSKAGDDMYGGKKKKSRKLKLSKKSKHGKKTKGNKKTKGTKKSKKAKKTIRHRRKTHRK